MSWRTIKNILDHRFFANLYIWLIVVPVAANTVKLLPPQISFPAISPELILPTSLPISWIALYFAALGAYICWLLYAVFCPQYIQLFENAADAIAKGETTQSVKSRAAGYLTKIEESFHPEEMRLAFKLAETWRANYDVELGAIELASKDKLNCRRLGEYVDSTVIRESSFKAGYYELPKGSGSIFIEKTQFLKHVCHDLNNISEVANPKCRFAIVILLSISGLLALFVVGQGMLTVFRSM
ncbi:hypothetical protein N9L47_11275 [Rhodobacteraceae bacterium]|nr:hypothetical protein [Paracoccaceae bacterium]